MIAPEYPGSLFLQKEVEIRAPLQPFDHPVFHGGEACFSAAIRFSAIVSHFVAMLY